VLASLELIAEEIEEPFGKDVNDLPMGKNESHHQKKCHWNFVINLKGQLLNHNYANKRNHTSFHCN
jgi:predicted membrane chloride channel (bestrophin family)